MPPALVSLTVDRWSASEITKIIEVFPLTLRSFFYTSSSGKQGHYLSIEAAQNLPRGLESLRLCKFHLEAHLLQFLPSSLKMLEFELLFFADENSEVTFPESLTELNLEMISSYPIDKTLAVTKSLSLCTSLTAITLGRKCALNPSTILEQLPRGLKRLSVSLIEGFITPYLPGLPHLEELAINSLVNLKPADLRLLPATLTRFSSKSEFCNEHLDNLPHSLLHLSLIDTRLSDDCLSHLPPRLCSFSSISDFTEAIVGKIPKSLSSITCWGLTINNPNLTNQEVLAKLPRMTCALYRAR
jgi:hypothetical protein